MKDYLEFDVLVYDNGDIELYESRMKEIYEKAETLGMDPYDLMQKERIDYPSYSKARVSIKPDEISHFMESFSLEAKLKDPHNPDLDSVTIFLENGADIVVDSRYDDFVNALDKFFNPEQPKSTRRKKETN